jgi:ACS family tartrate transporter-like MFS transporter
VTGAPAGDPGSSASRTLARVRARLIPFLFVLYIVAYLDRINVGFAALQMNEALGFTPAVYGLGAGIFFISYFLFEIPSNLILERVGARLWIARIMISWGLLSAGMMFTAGETSFYVLRFLLGAAEAGFFPGMILYLTYWFPARERGRAVAQFMTATAIAGVIGGPVSGALLSIEALGLAGWQWMYLLEGLPAVALGVVVRYWMTDRPSEATWLSADERDWLGRTLAEERARVEGGRKYTLREVLLDPSFWRLSAQYFCIVIGMYGITFWLPQIVQAFARDAGDATPSALFVGSVSAIPYIVAAVAMVLNGAHSDRTGERRFHAAIPGFVAALGLSAAAFATSPAASMAALCVAAAGAWSAFGPFWAIPTSMLTGRAAAGGIALINSVGNLGGFVGPFAVGWVREATSSFSGGLLFLAGVQAVAGLIALTHRRSD